MKIDDTLDTPKDTKQLKERYSDYPNDDIANQNGPKYKIVVESQKDKELLQSAFENWHYGGETDTDIIAINYLVHEYREQNSFIIDSELFEKLSDQEK